MEMKNTKLAVGDTLVHRHAGHTATVVHVDKHHAVLVTAHGEKALLFEENHDWLNKRSTCKV